VVLPAQSAPERAGTFTSMTRRVQRFEAAVEPVGKALPGWQILRDLGQRFGVAEPFADAADVFDELVRAAPIYEGLSYDVLGPPAPPLPADTLLPFAPRTDARRVSYEGTAYAGLGGSGRQWLARAADGIGLDWRPRPPAPAPDGDALLLVPTRRLYDAGRLVRPSAILRPLVPPPYVVMSPFDATPRGLADGMRVRVAGPGGTLEGELRVADGLTPGTVLAPERLAWATPVRAVLGGAPHAPVRVERA
jgi:predicted molibdopterin-dependent oxidoreductase YjgC